MKGLSRVVQGIFRRAVKGTRRRGTNLPAQAPPPPPPGPRVHPTIMPKFRDCSTPYPSTTTTLIPSARPRRHSGGRVRLMAATSVQPALRLCGVRVCNRDSLWPVYATETDSL